MEQNQFLNDVSETLSTFLRVDKDNLNYIFQTIHTKGFFDRMDLAHLVSLGIPMFKVISEFYNIHLDQVKVKCDSRSISSKDFENMLKKMTIKDGLFYIDEDRKWFNKVFG